MSWTTTTRMTWAWMGLLGLVLLACGGASDTGRGHDHAEASEQQDTGPNGGRLLHSGDFTLELAIFERGRPPEFRAWAVEGDQPVAPSDLSLRVELTRLGGRVDRFDRFVFSDDGDFLRGEGVVAEPHSFEVSVEAVHRGTKHSWHYESFEGRTRIAPDVAESLGVTTAVAGPSLLTETVTVYGRIRPDPERVRRIQARFEGIVRKVHVGIGDRVEKGDEILVLESDESLNPYSVAAPISGIVTQRDANPGELTHDRMLLTITDTSTVWADLSIFPGGREGVRVGAPVSISPATGGAEVSGTVSMIEVVADHDQTVVARVVLANPNGRLLPGTFIEAEVTVDQYEVPLAVKKTGLQAFRDFTVVYAQVDDQYEVRMLEIGRDDGTFVEVLGGLEPGTRYVDGNSHLIKADIEKSGASHDH